ADPRLEPYGAGTGRDEVFEVGGQVAGTSEDDDEVDRAGDPGDGAMDGDTQDFPDRRVVDRDRNDLVARITQVARYEEGGLGCPVFGLDAEDGDPSGETEDFERAGFRLDDVGV